ncbi:MAG: hypothetical protein CME70_14590 [Halobacteriovorax sp.]|nr:hypothetical protein [Halobacteriovorax sp.]|tara:strand:+ start:217113 stop:218333 length:1221 start_codon:yes stop_codon:yes gene_type:complete
MRSKKNNVNLFEGYLVSSQLALLFFTLLKFKGLEPGPDNFFLASVIAINYFFIGHLWGWSGRLREEKKLGPFFLFQFLFLQAYAFESQEATGLYLALVPVIAAVYFMNSPHLKGLSFLRGKGMILLAIGPVSYLLFSKLFSIELASFNFLITLSSFAIWSAGLVSWGDLFRFSGSDSLPKVGDERLFVHDLVNQTHGLYLYLNFKSSAGESIQAHETEELIGEVKILQSLIKDHFGYEHRNLTETMDWVPFESFKKAHKKMVESFLPDPMCQSHFIYSGWISDKSDIHLREKCMVHFPSLYRVMINIVKNMADERTGEAQFTFHYDESGLHLVTRNKLASLKNDEDTAEGLTKLILGDKKLRVGEGLESIGALCQKLGGSYSFQIADGYWVNEIYLPDLFQTKKVA